MTNTYFSQRMGLVNDSNLNVSFEGFKRLFKTIFYQFESRGLFCEAFGYQDIYEKIWTPGTLTKTWDKSLINDVIFHAIGKDNLWPIDERYVEYSECEIFDLIEFLFKIVSKPIDRRKSSFVDLLLPYHPLIPEEREITFDELEGKLEYLEGINNILKRYQDKYIMSKEGMIEFKRNDAEIQLCSEIIKNSDCNADINNMINRSINKFLNSKGNEHEMHDAIRILADILESLKEIQIDHIRKEEKELFNIVNRFGIRHNTRSQLTKYNKEIYYPWIFYAILATINLKLHYYHSSKLNS